MLWVYWKTPREWQGPTEACHYQPPWWQIVAAKSRAQEVHNHIKGKVKVQGQRWQGSKKLGECTHPVRQSTYQSRRLASIPRAREVSQELQDQGHSLKVKGCMDEKTHLPIIGIVHTKFVGFNSNTLSTAGATGFCGTMDRQTDGHMGTQMDRPPLSL